MAIDLKERLEASCCKVEWRTARLRPGRQLGLQENAPEAVTAWPEHSAPAAMRLALSSIAAAALFCMRWVVAWGEEQLHGAVVLPMQAGALPKATEQARQAKHLGASIAVGPGAHLISGLRPG